MKFYTIEEIIVENPKSTLKVNQSKNEGEYIFFTSGVKTRFYNNFLCNGKNIFIATGGKANVSFYEGKAAYSTDCYSITTKPFVDAKFLFYILQSKITEIDKDMFEGAALKHLQKKQFKNIKIKVPTLAEQQCIVAKLDAAFAEINKAIATTKRKEIKSLSLYKVISREIFFKDKNKVSLKNIAKVIMGQSPKGESYNVDGIGVPLINGPVEFEKDAFGLSKSIKFTTKPTKYCEKGDLLLCVRGSTTGRMNIAKEKACIGRGVAAIRANENQNWINYFIQSSRDYIYSLGTGATFPNISLNQIEEIQIYFPKINEQKRQVEKLKAVYLQINIISNTTQKLLKNYQSLKSSFLVKELHNKTI